jgi:hypothetical protein
MTWRTEPTDEGEDLVYDGMEAGIAPSPHKGTANIQNANISTEQGEVLASFGRTAQQQAAISNGTLTPDGATLFNAPANLKAGQWISVSASTVTDIGVTTSPSTVNIEYLAVGGGGSGGPSTNTNGGGGGGGAGQFATATTAFSVGSYAVTIGAGGVSNLVAGAFGGQTSIAGIITAYGGGSGGVSNFAGGNAVSGGSGGGGGAVAAGTAGTGGTGATGGNAGGNGDTTTDGSGGGGGGAGAAGNNATTSTGGGGGAGTSSSISGTSAFYAGGGGGGSSHPTGGGAGGSAIGGTGGNDNEAGDDAVANTGSGGGGGGGLNRAGGDGSDGIVILSYTTGSIIATGGVVTQVAGKTIHTFTSSDTFKISYIPQTNLYYVSYAVGGKIKLSAKYDPYEANELTHGTTGSITFSTVATPGAALAKATERFGTATSNEYRYYVLDNSGYVWVWDTNVFDTNGTGWMLPDPSNYSSLGFTGMNVLNGWLFCLNNAQIFAKPTVNLGSLFLPASNMNLVNPFPTHINYAYVGNQGKMYYTDLNYIGEVFPTTSLLTSLANIQSYGKYTASSTTGTVSALVSGSLPYTQTASGTTARIPVVFFTDVYGTAPTNLLGGTVYWIEYNYSTDTFAVYAASTGGAAIDIATGATGNQYFNTFSVFGNAGVNGSSSTVQFSQQRVNLPAYEVAQSLVEVGNLVIIGGKSNVLYPWNQIDATPSDFIELPENDVKTMINVNNMGYIFAGNKANVYITNGSIASFALKIPDYCAGVPGTPNSYIEPYFTWFDAMFLRGRVYCSILDQTATKAGNTGGVWSFIPTGNMSSTDTGLSLRLENQNSYGDYDGCARILIPNEEQNAISPQYWAWWQDSYTTGTSAFGIDTTSSTPVTTFVLETDLIPTGTLLSKDTFNQLEYKLSTNALTGDTVQLYYRLNSTDAWVTCGTAEIESTAPLSGIYNMAFQKTQWLQFRAVCSTPGTTASSFTRLAQIRLR